MLNGLKMEKLLIALVAVLSVSSCSLNGTVHYQKMYTECKSSVYDAESSKYIRHENYNTVECKQWRYNISSIKHKSLKTAIYIRNDINIIELQIKHLQH